jgi:hypothetical protein
MKLFYGRDPETNPATSEDLHPEEAGFIEGWSASLGATLSEELTISSLFPTEARSSRNKLLSDYIDRGDIPQSVAMFYGGDMEGLAGYARDELQLPGVLSQEEYQEKLKQEYAIRREYSQSVFEKTNWLGKIGVVAGTAHGYALDPVYAISALTGYGTAATIGKAALYAGMMEAGAAAFAQPFKMSFKDSIDSEYRGSDALKEIAFSGLGAAAFAAVGKALPKVLRRQRTPEDVTVGEAVEVFERLAKDAPELEPVIHTLKQADPNANAGEVLKASEAIDIRRAAEGPTAHKGFHMEPQPEAQKVAEAAFEARQPQRMVIEDRVSLIKGATPDKAAQFLADVSMKTKVAKRAEAAAIKADKAAKKAEKHVRIAEDSVAGNKARAAADRARAHADQLRRTADAAAEEATTAKALADETLRTAPKEGVPRGTPEPLESAPDTRHPLVVEMDDVVHKQKAIIKAMEECF